VYLQSLILEDLLLRVSWEKSPSHLSSSFIFLLLHSSLLFLQRFVPVSRHSILGDVDIPSTAVRLNKFWSSSSPSSRDPLGDLYPISLGQGPFQCSPKSEMSTATEELGTAPKLEKKPVKFSNLLCKYLVLCSSLLRF
jgi:hypothetical protein